MIIRFVSSCIEIVSYAILYFLFSSVLRFYFFTINLFGIPIIFVNYQDTSMSIAPNRTLDTWTFIGSAYEKRFGMIVLNIINVLGAVSFSMMIWLFGVSLFHLSLAARNELRVKSILLYMLVSNMILSTASYVYICCYKLYKVNKFQ